MANLSLESISRLVSGGGVSAISKRTKVKTGEVANVLSAGIPILLTGMQRNSQTKPGEDSLRGALTDHSTADISNIGAFLKTTDLKDGKKILGHVLGSNEASIVDRISKASGVTKGKTTSILALIAPLLLTLLGGQQQQQGSGFNLLSLLGGMLGGGQQQQQSPNLLGMLLGGGQQQQPVQQQQQSSSLLGALLGGGQQQQPVQQPVQQQQSSGLLGALLGGGQQQQQGGDLLLPVQQQQQQVQPVQGGSVLDALGGLGGLASLFADDSSSQQQQQQDDNSLLDGFLSLFH